MNQRGYTPASAQVSIRTTSDRGDIDKSSQSIESYVDIKSENEVNENRSSDHVTQTDYKFETFDCSLDKDLEQVQRGECLGEGTFGKVY